MGNRIKWIDVARCIGIFAIVLGHNGTAAGNAYPFVFKFHVQLFFLISGCMYSRGKELSSKERFLKICSRILVPWLIFCAIAIAANVVQLRSFGQIGHFLKVAAMGTIRNQFFLGIWFLTCLAAMEILFSVIRKLRNKVLIVLVCLLMFIASQHLLPKNPIVAPFLPYNVDSVMYFVIYYAIGYVSFPYVDKALNPQKITGKVMLAVSAVLAALFSAFVFFKRDPIAMLPQIKYISDLYVVIRALVIIWLVFVLARILQNVELLSRVGRNTLYLCGGEYAVRVGFSETMRILGISWGPKNLLQSIAYAVVILWIGSAIFAPVVKKILEVIYRLPQLFREKVSGVR